MLEGDCCGNGTLEQPNKRQKTTLGNLDSRLLALASQLMLPMDPLATTTSSSLSTVVRDASQQKRSSKLVATESTDLQETTEAECQPFFVDLKSLRRNSRDHLRDTGLLPAKEGEEHHLEICLIRERHYSYLSRVFLPSLQPLGRNLVALDSSRPWMMYWTLHGSDLLMVPNADDNEATEDAVPGTSLLSQRVGDEALCAVVSTLKACWQSLEDMALPQHLKLTEQDRSLLEETSGGYKGGGFGGGPGQMAHAATTYAAVLTLCIVATSAGPTSSNMAWSLLGRIRKPIYAWFLSLQQPHGGFRMHHDGEIDVRGRFVDTE